MNKSSTFSSPTRRDMNLIRALLLSIEDPSCKIDLSAWSDDHIKYHQGLLVKGGLADGTVIDSVGAIPSSVIIKSITWEGFNFLDLSRDERIWQEYNRNLQKIGGSTSYDVTKAILIQAARHYVTQDIAPST